MGFTGTGMQHNLEVPQHSHALFASSGHRLAPRRRRRTMSWRTNPFTIWARSVSRRAGVNRLLGRLSPPRTYEDRFRVQLLSGLRTGDCVWDVGANVGVYSRELSERVGERGRVVSFEPSRINFENLRVAVGAFSNVELLNVALGNSDEMVHFQQGSDPLGATSRIAANPVPGGDSVRVARGQELVRAGTAPRPNAIKVDTEGHELEVVLGLGELLADPALRVLGIEVHFGLLEARGMRHAPERIERILEGAGFAISWPDASHIVAERETQ